MWGMDKRRRTTQKDKTWESALGLLGVSTKW